VFGSTAIMTEPCREKDIRLIPVAVVLMPFPRAAGERLFDAHLGVPVIDLVAEELFHGINDPVAPGNRAKHIFTRFVPKHQPGDAAFGILAVIGMLFEGLIGLRCLPENVGFFRVKQTSDDEITVALELDDLSVGKDPVAGRRARCDRLTGRPLPPRPLDLDESSSVPETTVVKRSQRARRPATGSFPTLKSSSSSATVISSSDVCLTRKKPTFSGRQRRPIRPSNSMPMTARMPKAASPGWCFGTKRVKMCLARLPGATGSLMPWNNSSATRSITGTPR